MDNKFNTRPQEITINLFAEGIENPIASTTTNASKGWKYTFKGLNQYDAYGKEIKYTIREEAVEGYETIIDGFDITNHKDIKESSIEKTSIKVNDINLTDENRNQIKLKIGDIIIYEIVVENEGNVDLTNVSVTDDHKVSVEKIEKINIDGTRQRDRNLERNATESNLLGKTTLTAGEKYVITVKHVVDDNTINEEDKLNGDKLINIATLTGKYGDEDFSENDDDKLAKEAKADIIQNKTSNVEGKVGNVVNKGDIIKYTITVENKGNISGITTVTDEMLKENIDNNKITMVDLNGKDLSKEESYETNCIKVTLYKEDGTIKDSSPINVNKLASGLGMTVDNGDRVVITFNVKVGNLLPGETITNVLKDHEEENVQNDVEAEIQINKKLVRPQETVIVIDLSRSMAEAVDFQYNPDIHETNDPFADTYEQTRWYALKQALDGFLENYMDGKNKVTIIGYSANAQVLVSETTDINKAKSGYSKVLKRNQFNEGRAKGINDVDNLEGTGSLLMPGTNIEDGLYQAKNAIGNENLNGAKVILMTDGEANKKGINGNNSSATSEEGINAAAHWANNMKDRGTSIYTVALSLGKGNQEYIRMLGDLSSKDENGKNLAYNTENIGELEDSFKEISEIISEQNISTVTKGGIIYLKDEIKIDTRYVKNIVLTIPDENGDNKKFDMTWNEFKKYYNSELKTIDITQFAKDHNIAAISDKVDITINMDTIMHN